MKKANWFTLFSILLKILIVLGLVLPCGTLMAQDEEITLEEVVVTGSRIVRSNDESPSPIVTVDEDLFDQSATLAIETQLNKLPQFTPTIDVPTSGGDIQPTARNTPGEATVALRGIGANRTLVLINGRRGTPSNGMGVLDINTIPVAAIEYVEAISGGASSTYGADAMAGVINFIMKDDFVGFELDAQSGLTQEDDNFEYQVSGVIGADVKEGRGNVMMAFSYNERNDALQKDRDWYVEGWLDPARGGTQFFPPYAGANLGTGDNPPDVDVLNTVMGLAEGAGFTEAPSGATYYLYGDQVFTGFDLGSEAGIPAAQAAGAVDGMAVFLQNNGRLGQNNITNFLILPMERYNTFTQGHYDINDYVSVFGMGYFSKVHTITIQEPGIITAGWGVNIFPTEENFPADPVTGERAIPDELWQILRSRTDPDGAFSVRSLLPMNRQTLTDTTTYNITMGLEGEIPGIDWSWEAFHSHGEAETYSQSIGYWSVERTRAVLGGYVYQMVIDDATGDPVLDFGGNPTYEYAMLPGYQNFGEGFEVKANPHDGGFGAATAYCTSGLNPFDWSGVTQDCLDAVKADVKTRMLMKQDIWEVNTQGPIFELPMGEVRGALGWSYRTNQFGFLSDNVNSEGQSFNDLILGLYPAQDSFGRIETKEYYGELMVPLLKDLPLVKNLTLELGARTSDYDTTGRSDTYKALFDYRTSDWLRFRGGYNRAERAPNIAELFLNPEQLFGVMSYGDVCSLRNAAAPTAANPETNDEWYEVVKICGERMDMVGTDLDSTFFYGAQWEDIYQYGVDHAGEDVMGQDLVDAGIVPQANFDNTFWQTRGGFGFLWPINEGNPDLSPERADTLTLGLVLDSPFEDTPGLDSWRISIDWYKIEIQDAIGEQSADIVMYQCVDPSFNSTYDSNSPYCQGFNRDARFGSLGQVVKSFYNNGAFETSGIDFSLNWSMDLGPGRLNVNTLINYLLDKSSTELVGVFPMVDYTGTLGPTENGLNGNSYEWRALTTLGYTYEDWRITLRHQFKSSIEQAAAARGIMVQTGYPSYHLFDLLMNYNMSPGVSLRFGIENLFDKEPPLGGVRLSAPDGMTGGSFSAGNYDTNGRRFYLGLRMYID